MPALVLEQRLQDAPHPWILREEVLRAAFLEVDHQKAMARVGAMYTTVKRRKSMPEMR